MSGGDASTPRPCIGVSACLLGEPVRYDGGHKREAVLLESLDAYVRWLPLCPEVEAGLGVPRPPIQLEAAAGGVRLVGVEDRRDHTEVLQRTCSRLLGIVERHAVCGFVLKSRSPTCAPQDAPLHDERGHVVQTGAGVFADALRRALPDLPVVSEEDLREAAGREAFLAAVAAVAAYAASRTP